MPRESKCVHIHSYMQGKTEIHFLDRLSSWLTTAEECAATDSKAAGIFKLTHYIVSFAQYIGYCLAVLRFACDDELPLAVCTVLGADFYK